jgi:uncharacterized membrane protein (DUF441 family)
VRQLKLWSVAILIGFVVTMTADDVLDSVGHDPMMSGGLSVGAGVAAAALTARWLERRKLMREQLAQLNGPPDED